MRFSVCMLLLVYTLSATPPPALSQQPDGRETWTTSRIKGLPEPPLPFVTRRIFSEVDLQNPTEMIRVPGTDRWIVTQLNGSIVSFSNSGEPDQESSLDLRKVSPTTFRVLGIVFHPEFPARQWCYVAYADEIKSPTGVKLSRFRVSDPDIPTIDPATETVILKWDSTDHNGGNLQFGPDGFLYLSIGDGQFPNPPDPAGTGQDISDLQASILRIDVEKGESGKNYRIPADNPFVGIPGNARGEIWAFGLRNPWKMCFHPTTGELWTGDVGWEMREMVYQIERGANYGWSVMEGSQVVKTDAPRSKIPISPPILEHDHTEARSITGGFFWQHESFPELENAYIYGDWMTGKIWGLKYDGSQVTWRQEIADTNLQIISFANDNGKVLIVGYDGSIHELIPNPAIGSERSVNSQFPKRLSETGIFASVADQVPSPGVLPYSINAHHWADHTYSQQWFGIPNDAKMSLHNRDDWTVGHVRGDVAFPHDTVFAKTVYIQTDVSDKTSERRLETQVLHRHHDDWNAYNYVWNEQQTDAFLQPNMAVEETIEIKDSEEPGGVRKQTWLHASRDQCMLCHIWRAGTVHGFKLDQLNRSHAVGESSESENQLDKFNRYELFTESVEKPVAAVSPFDESAPLQTRARHYLHLNCAHCHRLGGGGTSAFQLEKELSLENANLIDTSPAQGDFGILDPKIIASGNPDRSVLLYRMLKSGRGHMPQFGTSIVDDKGVELIANWVGSLDSSKTNPSVIDPIGRLIELGREPGSSQFQSELDSLLQSTSSAISLAIHCSTPEVSGEIKQAIAARSVNHPRQEIRELFERFLPFELRKTRLGSAVDPDVILKTEGDVGRGRALYFESDLTCKNCHQIGGLGTNVGPDLSGIGSQRLPVEILASILDPSAMIEEAFRGEIIVTADGEIFSGLKVAGDEGSIHIVDIQGERHSVSLNDVEDSRTMKKSIMPDQLLAELSLQEAADLMCFLLSQKVDQHLDE